MIWGRTFYITVALFPVAALFSSLSIRWNDESFEPQALSAAFNGDSKLDVIEAPETESVKRNLPKNGAHDTGSALNAGDICFQSGDFEKAIEFFQVALQVPRIPANDNNASVHYRLALSFEAIAQFENSRTHYLAAAKSSSVLNTAAQNGLLRILEKTGAHKDALQRRCEILMQRNAGEVAPKNQALLESFQGETLHRLASSLARDLSLKPVSFYEPNSIVSFGQAFDAQPYLTEWTENEKAIRKSRFQFAGKRQYIAPKNGLQKSVSSTSTISQIPSQSLAANEITVLQQGNSLASLVLSISNTQANVLRLLSEIDDHLPCDMQLSASTKDQLKSVQIAICFDEVSAEALLHFLGSRFGFIWTDENKTINIKTENEIGREAVHQSKMDRAIFFSTMALLEFPEHRLNRKTQALYGNLLYQKSEWDRANAAYTLALHSNGNEASRDQSRFAAELNFNLAKSLMQEARLVEAKSAFLKVVDGAIRQDLRGQALLEVARIEVYLANFHKAIRSLDDVISMAGTTKQKKLARVLKMSLMLLLDEEQPQGRNREPRIELEFESELKAFGELVIELARIEQDGSGLVDRRLLGSVVNLENKFRSKNQSVQLLETFPHMPLTMAKAYEVLGLETMALHHLEQVHQVSLDSRFSFRVYNYPLGAELKRRWLELTLGHQSETNLSPEFVKCFGAKSDAIAAYLKAKNAFWQGKYSDCIKLCSAILQVADLDDLLRTKSRELAAKACEKEGDHVSATVFLHGKSVRNLIKITEQGNEE